MARNGSGTFSLSPGNPVVTNTVISSTWANTTLSDIATALTQSIAKDGQTTPTANLPMGGYKHTGLGAGSTAGDSLRYEQLFNSGTLSLPGNLTVSGAINTARGSVAMHATTMDLWAQPNIIDGTGSAVTITDIADAPQAGAVRILYPVAGTTITDNATFDVDGNANYTTVAGDALIFEAVTTSTFKVHIVKSDGTAVVSASTQIQPISASVGSNALTISASALSLDFRDTTLGSGTVTRVSGTPSNLVISSGSTLGTTSAVQSDIVILAINNAGTIELAAVNMSGGVDLSETGLISTTAEGGAGAADSATTIYSATARTNVAYRVIGIIRSTQATAGTWATAPSLIQGAGGQAKFTGTSMVRLNTANGYGSTNTKIRRFTNVSANQGSDITYADSATLGASFTINTTGVYAISYTEWFNAAGYFGISKNSTQLTTNIPAINAAAILTAATTPAADFATTTGVTVALSAGDVIRAHADGTTTGSGSFYGFFTITRTG